MGRKFLFHASRELAIQLIQCTYGIDLRPRLAGIQTPTLILHGAEDAIVPPRDKYDSKDEEVEMTINIYDPHPDEYASFYADYIQRASRREDIQAALSDQIEELLNCARLAHRCTGTLQAGTGGMVH